MINSEVYGGDGAAYLVTCEQLGVDPDDGYDLMASVMDAV